MCFASPCQFRPTFLPKKQKSKTAVLPFVARRSRRCQRARGCGSGGQCPRTRLVQRTSSSREHPFAANCTQKLFVKLVSEEFIFLFFFIFGILSAELLLLLCDLAMIASKKHAVRAKQLTTTFDPSNPSPGRRRSHPSPGKQHGKVSVQTPFKSATSVLFFLTLDLVSN